MLGYNILRFVLLVFNAGAVRFSNLPATAYVNENTDSETILLTVNATCYPYSNADTIYHTVTCEHCDIGTNPAPGLFNISGKTVYKKACSNSACGNYPSGSNCSSFDGCTNSGESFNIIIRCYSKTYETNDFGISILTILVTEENPALTINLPATVKASKSMSQYSNLYTIDKTSGPHIVEWSTPTSISSYLLNTKYLFDVYPENGTVYIKEDPSQEYTYWYEMEVCIYSRRQQSCGILTINFDGCFQQPTCIDQNVTTTDQHGIGETLFVMDYPLPTAHFASISPTWQNLTFEIASTTLEVATINATTGDITTTGNITVLPGHHLKQFTIVVRVSNPGYSCAFGTCKMFVVVFFTKWPLQIEFLPTSYIVHEDTDAEMTDCNITTSDFDNLAQDNVMCKLAANDDPSLLELYQGGRLGQTSYSIRKKACNKPGCGYLADDFLCPLNSGCLNYNSKNVYTVTVTCSDAYGENDTSNFTLYIQRNEIPTGNNNASVTVDTSKVSVGDVLFPIAYNDTEGEDLTFNFIVSPEPPQPLFAFGNNQGNPLITAARCLRLVNNTIYNVSWKAYDRRNLVHGSLIINLTNTCNTLVSPSCGYYNFTSTCDVIIATFNCHAGYVISGTSTRYCQSDGSWNGTHPTCVCSSPSVPKNGAVSISSDKTKAVYSCDSGFTLLGVQSRICQKDGSGWTYVDPRCDILKTDPSISTGTLISITAACFVAVGTIINVIIFCKWRSVSRWIRGHDNARPSDNNAFSPASIDGLYNQLQTQNISSQESTANVNTVENIDSNQNVYELIDTSTHSAVGHEYEVVAGEQQGQSLQENYCQAETTFGVVYDTIFNRNISEDDTVPKRL